MSDPLRPPTSPAHPNLKQAGPPPEERRCTAHSKRTGERCKEWTSDPRITVCRFHGGAIFDPETGQWKGGGSHSLTSARYSQAVANLPVLEQMYQRVLADPDMMETAEEIALARAYLGTLLEKGGPPVVSGKMVGQVMAAVDTIDKMVTRRHQRLHGANLSITVRDWEALVTRILDIAHEFFGESPRYVQFVQAVANMNQPRSTYIEWKNREMPPLAPPEAPAQEETDDTTQ